MRLCVTCEAFLLQSLCNTAFPPKLAGGKIFYWPHSHFLQARKRCIWTKECAALCGNMAVMPLNFNINSDKWQMLMYTKIIWVSCFAKVGCGWKRSTVCSFLSQLLKSSLCQSQSDTTINDCRVNVSGEHYKLLCHKISCVCCTLLPTATQRSVYADDLLHHLSKSNAERESRVLGKRGWLLMRERAAHAFLRM